METQDTNRAVTKSKRRYLNEHKEYDGSAGWMRYDGPETVRGKCSRCGWPRGDHNALDEACPAVKYEETYV